MMILDAFVASMEEETIIALSEKFSVNEKKLFKIISKLLPNDFAKIAKRFGRGVEKRVKEVHQTAKREETANRIRKNKELKEKKKEEVHKRKEQRLDDQNIPTTIVESSWIYSIAWESRLHILILVVKKGQSYKLPFFPRRVANAMLKNNSAGKTLWNGYWRVVGKGSESNKENNLRRVNKAKAYAKKFNSFQIKSINIHSYNKNVKTNDIYGTTKQRINKEYQYQRIKTSNIKGTGAKGIKIQTIQSTRIKKIRTKRSK